jgi:hypothetical protein
MLPDALKATNRVSSQDIAIHCDPLPNAQSIDRPSKQIHVTTNNPDLGRHASLANESRIRCRHRYTPVVYLQLYALRIPVFADIDHIRHFLLLLQGVTACRIACE